MLAYDVPRESSQGAVFGKSKGPDVIPPDFEEGDVIPDELKLKLLRIAPDDVPSGTEIGLGDSAFETTIHHGSAEDAARIAADAGRDVGELLAWTTAGSKIHVPPGRGLSLDTLAHEVFHVHQIRTIPNFFKKWELYGGAGNPFNRLEQDADRFARGVLSAN